MMRSSFGGNNYAPTYNQSAHYAPKQQQNNYGSYAPKQSYGGYGQSYGKSYSKTPSYNYDVKLPPPKNTKSYDKQYNYSNDKQYNDRYLDVYHIHNRDIITRDYVNVIPIMNVNHKYGGYYYNQQPLKINYSGHPAPKPHVSTSVSYGGYGNQGHYGGGYGGHQSYQNNYYGGQQNYARY
jgi:hypothetical protein